MTPRHGPPLLLRRSSLARAVLLMFWHQDHGTEVEATTCRAYAGDVDWARGRNRIPSVWL